MVHTTEGKQAHEVSFSIRRSALQHKVFNVTSLNAAAAVTQAYKVQLPFDVYKLQALHTQG